MKGNALSERPWWQRAVIYQIYPRSFQDSNGDGVGDLKGILERVDYLAWLGVDALWTSPVFTCRWPISATMSPTTSSSPLFGTLRDFDQLVESLHRRGIRLILDFVPNHTSEAHPWFRELRIAQQPEAGLVFGATHRQMAARPPWRSFPSGSAWKLDHETGQYYLHSFLTVQPDLNWRNPDVRAAMYDVLRFWLTVAWMDFASTCSRGSSRMRSS